MSRAHDTSHITANLMFHSTLKQHRRQLAGTCSSNQQATDRCCAWNRSHCHWHISHARQWGKVTQPDTKRKLCMTCPSFQWVTCHFWPNFSSEASNAMWQDLHVISGVLKFAYIHINTLNIIKGTWLCNRKTEFLHMCYWNPWSGFSIFWFINLCFNNTPYNCCPQALTIIF